MVTRGAAAARSQGSPPRVVSKARAALEPSRVIGRGEIQRLWQSDSAFSVVVGVGAGLVHYNDHIRVGLGAAAHPGRAGFRDQLLTQDLHL